MKKYYYLALIVVLGIFLRFYNISISNIWGDEAYTWQTYQEGLSRIWDILKFDTHPPLHNILSYLWTRVFGDSEFGIRSLSVLFGVLIIPISYLFFVTQTKDKANSQFLSLAGTAFVTVNLQQIIYSQEGRAYAVINCLTVLLFLILSNPLSYRRVFFLAFVSIVGIYSHSIFFIILFMGFVWNYIYYPLGSYLSNFVIKLKYYSLYFLISVLAYLPWLVNLSSQVREKQEFWLKFNPFTDFQNNFFTLFTSELVDNSIVVVPYLVNIIYVTVFVLLALGIITTKKTLEGTRVIFLPIIMLLIPYLVSFYSPIYYVRYIQYVIPFLILLMIFGLDIIYQKSKSLAKVIVLIFVFASLGLYFVSVRDNPSSTNYFQVIEYIKNRKVSNTILHPTPETTYNLTNYYAKKNNFVVINKIFTFDKQTIKNYQKAVIKPEEMIINYKDTASLYVISEWDIAEVKTTLEAKNYCKYSTKIFDGKIKLEEWRQNRFCRVEEKGSVIEFDN